MSGALIDLMTYLWGRRNTQAQIQVLFFAVRAAYLPWVLAWISLLMGGSVQALKSSKRFLKGLLKRLDLGPFP